MKKSLFLSYYTTVFALSLLTACSFSHDEQSLITDKRRMALERTNNTAMEEKIEELLAEMTLEEKVGQMMQINNNMI